MSTLPLPPDFQRMAQGLENLQPGQVPLVDPQWVENRKPVLGDSTLRPRPIPEELIVPINEQKQATQSPQPDEKTQKPTTLSGEQRLVRLESQMENMSTNLNQLVELMMASQIQSQRPPSRQGLSQPASPPPSPSSGAHYAEPQVNPCNTAASLNVRLCGDGTVPTEEGPEKDFESLGPETTTILDLESPEVPTEFETGVVLPGEKNAYEEVVEDDTVQFDTVEGHPLIPTTIRWSESNMVQYERFMSSPKFQQSVFSNTVSLVLEIAYGGIPPQQRDACREIMTSLLVPETEHTRMVHSLTLQMVQKKFPQRSVAKIASMVARLVALKAALYVKLGLTLRLPGE